jgi:hypothetical protein
MRRHRAEGGFRRLSASGSRRAEAGGSPAGGRLDGLPVIPRQPSGRVFGRLGSVSLEGHQVVERIDPIQLAGVDEAHENVADVRSVERLEAQGIFPMKDGHLQSALDDVMPPPGLCRAGMIDSDFPEQRSTRLIAEAA